MANGSKTDRAYRKHLPSPSAKATGDETYCLKRGKDALDRRTFLKSVGGLAVLSTASLEAACADGPRTLVIGASRAGCAYALAHPAETLLLERGILPAAECGPAETDAWAARLLEVGCHVLLDAELARIEELPAGGFRAVAYGPDGRHVFDVAAVKDLSVKGWHKGEWR